MYSVGTRPIQRSLIVSLPPRQERVRPSPPAAQDPLGALTKDDPPRVPRRAVRGIHPATDGERRAAADGDALDGVIRARPKSDRATIRREHRIDNGQGVVASGDSVSLELREG